MPKSDTWPGGVGLEKMTSMDSAGSCDSVVSANSGYSDDSMEHLSAEEKACLMFLEETIESLDTEEDSGLSNDEPDQLPSPGNLATKLADLSASMNKSKLTNSPKHTSADPMMGNGDVKMMQSYLVPTPLVMASSSPCPEHRANPGVPTDRNVTSKSHVTPSSKELGHKHNQKPVPPQVPLEVNVVISPPNKPRDCPVKTPEAPLNRGPLSYEALFYLRRSASTKKTPLCPTIDHTIESDKRRPITVDDQNHGNPPKSVRFHPDVPIPKASPPVVAPKPKKIPVNICAKTQKQDSIKDSLYNIKHATDPKVVRMEALQKLGLLKDEEQENATLALPNYYSSMDHTCNGFTEGPSPSRNPSFSHSQVRVEPKTKPLQSSASFHHYSRSEQQPVFVSNPTQSNGVGSASLVRSNTLGNHRNGGNCPELQHNTTKKPVNTAAVQQGPNKSSSTVPYTVMMVPGMGADRREALRKLGLLKI
ncbi:specifically androgen-regulated gene protein [Notolabrus celidotus]|uniref:specifically androgen-regulated gene protein n=1 Tax=Notolabrus celidotus TaxID=1203425 RepID=UPI0014901E90|nr:specifically androgen-regulated gene protein [Notolabrus celidotus]